MRGWKNIMIKKTSPKSTSTGRVNDLRKNAAKRNRCKNCLSRKPTAGSTKCKPCADATAEAVDRARARARSKGLCANCTSRPVSDRIISRGPYAGQLATRCDFCIDGAAERARETYARKIATESKPKPKAKKKS